VFVDVKIKLMKKRKLAQTKDLILKELLIVGNSGCSTVKLSTKLNIEHYVILYLSEDLFLNDFVKKIEVSTNAKERAEYILTLNHSGTYFLNMSGGYIRNHRAYRTKQIIDNSKIIIILANAIVMTLLTWLLVKNSII
jgi:hypothetical protein